MASVQLDYLQLSNYLKVPINYFFEDFSEYLIKPRKISRRSHECEL